MKITILNASEAGTSFDNYLNEVSAILRSQGHEVNNLLLREEDIRYCIGCWDCWVKTPGRCQANDGSINVDSSVIHADIMIIASPTRMGFLNSRMKKTMDKIIPLLLPYIQLAENEAHHFPRYDHYPAVAAIIEPDKHSDAEDLDIISNILTRVSLNFNSKFRFMLTSDTSAKEAAAMINTYQEHLIPLPPRLEATSGSSIPIPKHLTVFNGSPRGRKSNSLILLNQFLKGFADASGSTYEIHNLNRTKSRAEQVEAIRKADCVLLAHPLYTDAMPGIVMDFFEHLEPLIGEENPPMMFLVQSGFPEAGQSRYAERYLEKLAKRLGSQYIGTMVRGGVEGIQIMPESMTRKMFTNFYCLGADFGKSGQLDPALLKDLAGVEFFSGLRVIFQKAMSRLPLAEFYWNSQLKANGAFNDRFARPFEITEK